MKRWLRMMAMRHLDLAPGESYRGANREITRLNHQLDVSRGNLRWSDDYNAELRRRVDELKRIAYPVALQQALDDVKALESDLKIKQEG